MAQGMKCPGNTHIMMKIKLKYQHMTTHGQLTQLYIIFTANVISLGLTHLCKSQFIFCIANIVASMVVSNIELCTIHNATPMW